MGSNKNNLKRSKMDDIFNTSFDEPKPMQYAVPSAPRASRLVTCPNCKQGYCSEFLDASWLDRYCTACGLEERHIWNEVDALVPELQAEIKQRAWTASKGRNLD